MMGTAGPLDARPTQPAQAGYLCFVLPTEQPMPAWRPCTPCPCRETGWNPCGREEGTEPTAVGVQPGQLADSRCGTVEHCAATLLDARLAGVNDELRALYVSCGVDMSVGRQWSGHVIDSRLLPSTDVQHSCRNHRHLNGTMDIPRTHATACEDHAVQALVDCHGAATRHRACFETPTALAPRPNSLLAATR